MKFTDFHSAPGTNLSKQVTSDFAEQDVVVDDLRSQPKVSASRLWNSVQRVPGVRVQQRFSVTTANAGCHQLVDEKFA